MRARERAVPLIVALVVQACASQTMRVGSLLKGGCGDPNTVSQTYVLCRGHVGDVLDGKTVLVDLVGECPVRDTQVTGRVEVHLVQLSLPSEATLAQRAKSVLASRSLGKNVDIVPSPYQSGHGVVAIVHAPVDQSVAQLETGLASYRNYGDYAVDWYSDCVYKRAEDRARTAKVGMWAGR